MRFSFLAILMFVLLVGCKEGPFDDAANSAYKNPYLQENQAVGQALELAFDFSPQHMDRVVHNKVIIDGTCSHAGSPIILSSNFSEESVYSICQDDFTWAAFLDLRAAPIGSFSISARAYSQDYTQESEPKEITVRKEEERCDNQNATHLFANYEDGADGESIPFIICNSEQFSNIRFYPDKNFELGRDIDFGNAMYSPILTPFKGKINGRGFSLENLLIRDKAGAGISVGLFKYAHNAEISNLNLRNINVEGYQRVGILAGDWRGGAKISNVKVQGRVSGISYVGGLFGVSNGASTINIDNIQSKVDVNGNQYAGGLIGQVTGAETSLFLSHGTLETNLSGNNYIGGVIGSSFSEEIVFKNINRFGKLTGHGVKIGGLIGSAKNANLHFVKNKGEINGLKAATDVYIGGFIGLSDGNIIIENSESDSYLASAGDFTGGLIGKARSVEITDTLSRGSLTVLETKYNSVTRFAGGLVGSIAETSLIQRSRSYMDIKAKTRYVGGLVGSMNGINSKILKSFYRGNLAAFTTNVGGLVGQFSGASILESFVEGELNITNPTPKAYIGGVAGMISSKEAYFKNLYFKGKIQISDGLADYVGGVFGYLGAGTLSESFVIGAIKGARSITGALVGYLKGEILNSYASVEISASLRHIGGIAGILNNGKVLNVFSQSKLSGKGEVGGLIGSVFGAKSEVNNSYYSGSILKVGSAQFENRGFGYILGGGEIKNISGAIYASDSSCTDENGALVEVNQFGKSVDQSNLKVISGYEGYEFSSLWWAAPNSDFKLPLAEVHYPYAVPAWVYSFEGLFFNGDLSDTAVNGPIELDIFPANQNYENEITPELLRLMSEKIELENLRDGDFLMSLDQPVENSVLNTPSLILTGECGIPGSSIQILGDFRGRSICQPNNRWVIRFSTENLSLGPVEFSVSMSSFDGSQATESIHRKLIKEKNICWNKEASFGVFANSQNGGNGVDVPFQICNAGQFFNIAYYPHLNFELARDIDFKDSSIPSVASVFTGSLDGNGHALRNFHLEGKNSVGIFSIAKDASFKNIKIKNGNVSGYQKVGLLVGSFSGSGTLENIEAQGRVKGILYTGGIVGVAGSGLNLTLSNIQTDLVVDGNSHTGGVIGHIPNAGGYLKAQNFKLAHKVTGLSNVGGVIGSSFESNFQLSNMIIDGEVHSFKENIGGVAGFLFGGSMEDILVRGSIKNEYVAAQSNVGGIVGVSRGTELSLRKIEFQGEISAGGDNVGGIIGKMKMGELYQAQTSGTISVYDGKYSSVRANIGGIAGLVEGNSKLNESSSKLQIQAQAQYCGGLVGRFYGDESSIEKSSFMGSINAQTSYIGGIAGYFSGALLSEGLVGANIVVSNATPKSYVGGLIGYAGNGESDFNRIGYAGDILINDSLADFVGGVIGYFKGGRLKDCSSSGSIMGARSTIGGVAGFFKGNMSSCFSTVKILGKLRGIGGLVGLLFGGRIENSFSSGDIRGANLIGGAIGKVDSSLNSVSNVYFSGSLELAGIDPLYSEDEVESGPLIGGGEALNNTEVSASYYVENQGGSFSNSLGTLLDAQSAKLENAYEGFDFSELGNWNLPSGPLFLADSGAPYLYPVLNRSDEFRKTREFTIGVSVDGLDFGKAMVQLNQVENGEINAEEREFTFQSKLFSGEFYNVDFNLVGMTEEECSILNANGLVINKDVLDIKILCSQVESLQFSHEDLNLEEGATRKFKVLGHLANGKTIDITEKASFNTNNGEIVNISAGEIYGVKSGTSIVNVSYRGANIEKEINVLPKETSTIPVPAYEIEFTSNWINKVSDLGASPIFTWSRSQTFPSGSHDIAYVALGKKPGKHNAIKYIPAGEVFSFKFEALPKLKECRPYYASVKYLSSEGIYSEIATENKGFKIDRKAPVLVGPIKSRFKKGRNGMLEVRWKKARDNCAISKYEIALGTQAGGDDITKGFVNVGKKRRLDGSHSVFKNLAENSEKGFYITVRAVDRAGNPSKSLISKKLKFRKSKK